MAPELAIAQGVVLAFGVQLMRFGLVQDDSIGRSGYTPGRWVITPFGCEFCEHLGGHLGDGSRACSRRRAYHLPSAIRNERAAAEAQIVGQTGGHRYMDRLYGDWMDGVGTYLKVVWSPDPSKAFIVLYLRPNGRFLYGGYWAGYEYSLAAGVWQKRGREIVLDGRGQLKTDTIPGPDGGKFDRVFNVEDSNHTPVLRASTELKGWSLLGWQGDFVYVGPDTVIAPGWLPDSIAAVDSQINELLA